MARGVWTGSISFGLVSVGVKALTAVRDHDIHFHQIEKGTGSRIGNQKVSKKTGEAVDTDDIEMGYEIRSGRTVTFDSDELRDLRPESTRVIDVSDFVSLDSIDPVYFDRTYWLAPTDEGAVKAYRLLAAAMAKTQQVGIGSVVMRNKQYLAAIRPLDGALAMSTMRFVDEVVDIGDLDEIPTTGAKPSAKELALAEQIIGALAGDWDPTRYHDTYTEELTQLIEAKDRGDEVTPESESTPSGAKVLDLMAALQASVDAAKAERGAPSKPRGKPKSKPKRKPTNRAPAKQHTAKKKPASTAAKARKRPARKSA